MEQTICDELRRRTAILIENSSAGDIGTGMSGSRVRFNAALAIIGYPFQNPYQWMDENYLKAVMTEEEFHTDTYDSFISSLFQEAYTAVNGK